MKTGCCFPVCETLDAAQSRRSNADEYGRWQQPDFPAYKTGRPSKIYRGHDSTPTSRVASPEPFPLGVVDDVPRADDPAALAVVDAQSWVTATAKQHCGAQGEE